jgi:hypothetical protein
MSEQEVFLNTVYNMKPEEVFNRGLPRSAKHLKSQDHVEQSRSCKEITNYVIFKYCIC